jgi:hypothetical protein
LIQGSVATSALPVALILVCGLAIGCGGSSAPDPVATFIATLNQPVHKECQAGRDAAARYLLTGEPHSLDTTYLGERTLILKQPSGVQQAYIREYVNALVASCDNDAQAASDRAAFERSCVRLGGLIASSDDGGPVQSTRNPSIAWAADSWKRGQCIITYDVSEISQKLTYVIPLASNGSLDASKFAYNRDVRCKGHPEDFYTDTGVCVVVGFLS